MSLDSIFNAVQKSIPGVTNLSDEDRKTILYYLADEIENQVDFILKANLIDLSQLPKDNPKYDRLLLSKERIFSITDGVRKVAQLPSPLGKILSETTRPNGLTIKKVSVPFGVIAVIYEARPNVTIDVFSLCFKSGNACVLKGSKDAYESNYAFISIIQSVLKKFKLPENICTFFPTDRNSTLELLNARKYIDLLIPRGSRELIDFVRENARIPIIETGAGICHCYVDKDADISKAASIVNNAKTRRVSVCNALDCLIIHEAQLSHLNKICEPLIKSNVCILADEKSYLELQKSYPAKKLFIAQESDYETEFLDYKISIRTVSDIKEAIEHIKTHSTKHSEAIISENAKTIETFMKNIDAACVYANASTAFTDGGEFGLGAEIGISTQKLHARGPMGLEALTTYKYLIFGDGQIR